MRVTTAFHRLLGLPRHHRARRVLPRCRLRRAHRGRRGWAAPQTAGLPAVRFTTRARYDTRTVSPCVAAPPGQAGAAACRAAPGVLPDPRGAGGGGALRPGRDRVQPRLARTWWRSWQPRPTRPRFTRFSRVDWDSVGRICARVVADGLDPARLDGLVSIGACRGELETPPPLPHPGRRPHHQEDRVGR